MQAQILQPSPPLRPFVDVYIDMQSTSSSQERLHLYPAPSTSMAFCYEAGLSLLKVGNKKSVPSPQLSLGGYFTRPKEYHWKEKIGVFVICFKPWGMRRFTRFPIQEALNQNLELQTIYSNPIREIGEQLQEAASLQDRIQIIEGLLLSSLETKPLDRFIVDASHKIALHRGKLSVQSLAKQYALSRKQFVRRFQDTIGISPKLFSRIVRFQHTLNLLQGPVRNIEVAYESGYFDQAHFTKEFKELAGISPGKFFSSLQRSQLGEAFDNASQMSHFYNTIYE